MTHEIPRTGIVLPNVTTDELRLFALGLESLNPIGISHDDGDAPSTRVEVVDHGFMSIDLAFSFNDEPFHVLTFFAGTPTDQEIEMSGGGF